MTLKNIQTEVDASFLYKVLADNESDKVIANIFLQMSMIKHSIFIWICAGHANGYGEKTGMSIVG